MEGRSQTAMTTENVDWEMMGEDRGWRKTKVAFTSPGTHGLYSLGKLAHPRAHSRTFTLGQRKLDGKTMNRRDVTQI